MRCSLLVALGFAAPFLTAGCDKRTPADRATDDRDALLVAAAATPRGRPAPLGTTPDPAQWPGTPLPTAPWVPVADWPNTVNVTSPDWRRLDAVWQAPAGTPDPIQALHDEAAGDSWWPVHGKPTEQSRRNERLRYSRTAEGYLRVEQWEAQP